MGVYCKRIVVLIFLFVIALVFMFNYFLEQDAIPEGDWSKGRLPLKLANQMYRNCCVSLKLEPGCLEACRYDLSLKTARYVFFENQDQNSCDLQKNIQKFVKCANGHIKPKDNRPCCLSMKAIDSVDSKRDVCAMNCHPSGYESMIEATKKAKCAVVFRRILFCHFVCHFSKGRSFTAPSNFYFDMESFNTSLTFLGRSDCTAGSVVKALDSFLKSVQQMQETVMVPSRLKDVEGTLISQEPDDDLWSTGSKPKALVQSLPSKKVDLFSFYQMLHSIRNELVCGSPTTSSSEGSDSAYGSMSEEELEVEAEESPANDKHAEHLASLFRQHLTGLFLVLRQLTDAADYCSKKYQDEVDKQ